jgi:hypothetical protein
MQWALPAPIEDNMADIYTTTPGSAVAETLQAILARRKAEQRQAMLDQLSKQDHENRWKNDDATTAINQSAERRAGTMDTENILRGRVPLLPRGGADANSLAPDTREYVRGLGLIKDDPGTGGQIVEHIGTGTDVEADPNSPAPTFSSRVTAPSSRFIGSADHQKETEARERIAGLMGNQDFTTAATPGEKADPLKAVLMAGAAGAELPGELLPNTTRIVGHTGKLHQAIPSRRGDSTVELNQPAAALSAWTPIGQQGSNIIQQGPGGVVRLAPIPGDGTWAGKPGAGGMNEIVPQQAWNNRRVAIAGNNSMNRDEQAAAIKAADDAIKAIAISRGVSPQVMADLEGIMADIDQLRGAGQPVPPVPELINRIEGITDTERQQLSSLLYGFYGANEQ